MLWCAVLAACWLLVDGRLTRRSPRCEQTCDLSRCPEPPADCWAGQVQDACGCCRVCAAGEGDSCGGRADASGCGEELKCSVPPAAYPGKRRIKGVCVCANPEPVCGSDGSTYRNVCQLKAVSRRAQSLNQPPVIFIQRGACGLGKRWARNGAPFHLQLWTIMMCVCMEVACLYYIQRCFISEMLPRLTR